MSNFVQILNGSYQFVVICQDFQNQSVKCHKLNIKGQVATARVIQGAPVLKTLKYITLHEID